MLHRSIAAVLPRVHFNAIPSAYPDAIGWAGIQRKARRRPAVPAVEATVRSRGSTPRHSAVRLAIILRLGSPSSSGSVLRHPPARCSVILRLGSPSSSGSLLRHPPARFSVILRLASPSSSGSLLRHPPARPEDRQQRARQPMRIDPTVRGLLRSGLNMPNLAKPTGASPRVGPSRQSDNTARPTQAPRDSPGEDQPAPRVLASRGNPLRLRGNDRE